MKFSAFLIAGLLATGAATAASINTGKLTSSDDISIPKLDVVAKIDGSLDETVWQNARKILVNNETYPRENMPAPVKTEAYIYENSSTLFIAFKAYDPEPHKILANLSDRDTNWNDDRVAVKIDSYHDHALAYQFFVNPLGTQSDAIENELTKNESPAWDGIWESAGQLTDFGYQVEIAIPLRILNFDDSLDIQNWGMEFVRFYPRDTEMRISNAKMSQDNNCWICQMPVETGFSGAKQGRNLTVIPTLVTGTSSSRDKLDDSDDFSAWDEQSNTDIGLDVKWGITPDITLNATLNPDFSQVEADSGQVNVNNTFSLYLREKRSFFLENQDYFDTPVNLIYTRNINAPDYGAKVTGKSGAHSFAAFVANDESANIITPGDLGNGIFTIDQETVNSALRYRYTINKDLAVGLVSTTRKNDDYYNQVGSVDVKYQPNEHDTLNIQYITTNTDYSDQALNDALANFSSQSFDPNSGKTTLSFNEQYLRTLAVNENDDAYRIQYNHSNRDWYFNARHENFGKHFRADLAYINQVDRKKSVIGGGYQWRGEEEDWWTRFRVSGDMDVTYNQNGELLEQENEIHFNVNGPKQSFIRIGFMGRDRVGSRLNDEMVFEAHEEPKFNQQEAEALLAIDNNTDLFYESNINSWAEFKPTSNLWVGNFFRYGKAIDYRNNRLGDSFTIEPHLSYNVSRHMKSRFRYLYRTMDYEGKNVFNVNVIDWRNTYQFSIKSFLRLSLIYLNVDRNAENYVDPSSVNETYNNFSAQLLYSYKINPQTLFFVGYSQGGYEDDEVDKFTTNNKSVFMKLSYAWLL